MSSEQLRRWFQVGLYFYWNGGLYKITGFGERDHRATILGEIHDNPNETIDLLSTQLIDSPLYETVDEAKYS